MCLREDFRDCIDKSHPKIGTAVEPKHGMPICKVGCSKFAIVCIRRRGKTDQPAAQAQTHNYAAPCKDNPSHKLMAEEHDTEYFRAAEMGTTCHAHSFLATM